MNVGVKQPDKADKEMWPYVVYVKGMENIEWVEIGEEN